MMLEHHSKLSTETGRWQCRQAQKVAWKAVSRSEATECWNRQGHRHLLLSLSHSTCKKFWVQIQKMAVSYLAHLFLLSPFNLPLPVSRTTAVQADIHRGLRARHCAGLHHSNCFILLQLFPREGEADNRRERKKVSSNTRDWEVDAPGKELSLVQHRKPLSIQQTKDTSKSSGSSNGESPCQCYLLSW